MEERRRIYDLQVVQEKYRKKEWKRPRPKESVMPDEAEMIMSTPGPNPMNSLQACIYKLVNTRIFKSQLKSNLLCLCYSVKVLGI